MGSKVVERITERAVELNKSVVLPEAQDPRVIHAARQITDQKYARVTLLGNAQVKRYLSMHHREILGQFEKIVETETIDG